MDNNEISIRIRDLSQNYVHPDIIKEIYGLKVDNSFIDLLSSWRNRVGGSIPVVDKKGFISRWLFESFLTHTEHLTWKMAGYRCGTSENSFMEVFKRLKQKGLLTSQFENIQLTDKIIPESLPNKLDLFLPSVKDTTIWSSHTSRCNYLHSVIEKDLSIEITKEYSKMSSEMALCDFDEKEFSYDIDVFTGQGVGLRYRVELDFKKPFSLRPDATDLYFYLEQEKSLKKFLHTNLPPVRLEKDEKNIREVFNKSKKQ